MSASRRCIPPPHLDEAPSSPCVFAPPIDHLHVFVARILQVEARDAFTHGDKARFEAAVAALVELVLGIVQRP